MFTALQLFLASGTLVLFLLLGTLFIVSVVLLRPSWRSRAQLSWLDVAAPVAAFALWGALYLHYSGSKSLSNAVMEPALLVFAVGIVAAVRVAIGRAVSASVARLTTFLLLPILASVIAAFVPALPE